MIIGLVPSTCCKQILHGTLWKYVVLVGIFQFFIEHLKLDPSILSLFESTLQEFCSGLLHGTLPPYFKSEPIPNEVCIVYVITNFVYTIFTSLILLYFLKWYYFLHAIFSEHLKLQFCEIFLNVFSLTRKFIVLKGFLFYLLKSPATTWTGVHWWYDNSMVYAGSWV